MAQMPQKFNEQKLYKTPEIKKIFILCTVNPEIGILFDNLGIICYSILSKYVTGGQGQ